MAEKLKTADEPVKELTPQAQAKDVKMDLHKDEAGNVSLHNPECDKADVLYPSKDHVKK